MMRKSGSGVSYLAIIAGVAGYFLRATQLAGGSVIPLVAICVLMGLMFLLAVAVIDKNPLYEEVFSKSIPDMVVTAAAAVLIIAGCVKLMKEGGRFFKILALLGTVGALCAGASSVLRFLGKRPKGILFVPLTLFYVAKLFYEFRGWMRDPAILDYCFLLFAAICFMLTTYHAGAYCYDRGGRRRLAFFALCGMMFGAISMAGAPAWAMYLYGGSVLWMFACSTQAMGKR